MTTPDSPRQALHQALAAVELVNNDPDRARQLAELALAGASCDAETRAVASRVLGMVATLRSTLPEADRYLRDAMAIADAAGLPARSAEAGASLAYVRTLSGSTDEALTLLQRAIPALTGISAARASMLRSLVLTEIGDFGAADSSFGDAFSHLQSAGGDQLLEADLRNNRAVLRIHQRNWAAVEEDQRIAEALYLANGHQGRTALIFHNRGVAATTRGDLPAALAAYDEAHRRYSDAGRTSGLLPVERAEALLAVLLVDEARAAAEQAVADFTRQGNAVDLVQARMVLARAALLSADPQSARQQADRARRSALRQRRPGWAALAGRIALRARWQAGDYTISTLRTGLRNVAALSDAGRVVAAVDAQLIVAQMALGLGKSALAGRLLAQVRAASNASPAELR
ncbi:MAG: CHAT domain-containing protein, partial [Nakamurella sp.]